MLRALRAAGRKVMALLVRPGERPQTVRPTSGASFTLQELQGFVGGFIEVVRLRDDQCWLVLNENGKALQLAPNFVATLLFHRAGGDPDDVVVGDVLVATGVEMGEGEEEEDTE